MEQVDIALIGKSSCGGRHKANLHTHCLHTDVSLGCTNIPWNILAAPLQWQFQDLRFIWSEPKVSSKVLTALQPPSSHPDAQEVSMTCLLGGVSAEIPFQSQAPSCGFTGVS